MILHTIMLKVSMQHICNFGEIRGSPLGPLMTLHIFKEEKKIYSGFKIMLIIDVSLVCFQKMLRKRHY